MIIAIVLSTVTPSTVKIRLRSECSFFGRTAAIAMAVDAPQIATAPPVRSAKRHPRLNSRAPSIPNRMVRTTPATTKQMTPNPRLAISSTLTRIPRSATPKRRTLRAHGDPRCATTFLCKEMEGDTEQQRHQHRRRTIMIREELGGYGDDDRDKEPRHEQHQVLRQGKP